MAKRILAPTARWSFIAESLLPEDQPKISALKSAADRILRQMMDKPAELPKIDWSFYKSKISVSGMVDNFQKSYEGLKIPYPSDQGVLSATEDDNVKMIAFADKKLVEMLKKMEEYEKKLAELESVMKYTDMTMEEFYLARPDLKIDPDNPKLWPQHLKETPRVKEDH